MISIEVTRNAGVPVRVVSTGHAVASRATESAPCAAVSVVLKSFGLTLLENGSCSVSGAAPGEGVFDISCRRCADIEWYRGVASLLERTLGEIRTAWPDEVTVSYYEE